MALDIVRQLERRRVRGPGLQRQKYVFAQESASWCNLGQLVAEPRKEGLNHGGHSEPRRGIAAGAQINRRQTKEAKVGRTRGVKVQGTGAFAWGALPLRLRLRIKSKSKMSGIPFQKR